MKSCPNCGRENPADQDFCQCGEYLRWEPTGFMPALPPELADGAPAAPPTEPAPPAGHPAPAPPSPPPAAAERTAVQPAAPSPPPQAPAAPPQSQPATITLRLPDDAGPPGDPLAVGVHPGDRVRVRALIRNQSGIVDNYALRVDGLPADWCSILPDTVYLVPYGSNGTYEQEVEIHFHPPRAPEAEARVWELTVVAHSKANEVTVATAPLLLGIQPFEQHTVKVKPERASGRRWGNFDIAVENTANAPAYVAFDAAEPDNDCTFSFTPPGTEVAPAQTATSRMRVRPAKQIWIGRPHERRIEVAVKTGEEAHALAEAHAASADERGGRKLPGGLAPQVYKGNLHIGPGGVQMSKPMVRGPQAAAGRMHGVNVNLDNLKMPGGAAPAISGPLLPTQAVFRQKPWLPWWSPIVLALLLAALLLAWLLIPRGQLVPDVAGMTVAEASGKLAEEELLVGRRVLQVDPATEPGIVLGQNPAAGERADKGSAVGLTVAVRESTIRVPNLVDRTVRGAQRRLEDAGLTLGTVQPSSADPEARVSFQNPSAGKEWAKGAPVDVSVGESTPKPDPDQIVPPEEQPGDGGNSGGPETPGENGGSGTGAADGEMVFVEGASLQIVSGDADEPEPLYTAPEGTLKSPSMAPDRRVLVAWTAEGDESTRSVIEVVDGEPLEFLPTGSWHRPVYSPTGSAVVVVDANDGFGAGRLCWVDPAGEPPAPLCKPEDLEWEFGRPTWSPDGTTVLALGRPAEANGQDTPYTRVFAFHSDSAESALEGDWTRANDALLEGGQIAYAALGEPGLAVLRREGSAGAHALEIFPVEDDGTLGESNPFQGQTGVELAWSPSGDLAIATDAVDGPIRRFDPETGEERGDITTSGASPAWRGPSP